MSATLSLFDTVYDQNSYWDSVTKQSPLSDRYIVIVAARLFCDDLRIENYTKEKAILILKNTVMPTLLIRIFNENEQQILNIIQNWSKTSDPM
jgi:hypothetical protein